MPVPYLTTGQATARLALYAITAAPASPSAAELAIASDALDQRGNYVGEPASTVQLRSFPRSITIADDLAGAVPDRVLDWVALRAYQLSIDDAPPIAQEKVGSLGVQYRTSAGRGRGKVSRPERLMANLLRAYRAGGASAPII